MPAADCDPELSLNGFTSPSWVGGQPSANNGEMVDQVGISTPLSPEHKKALAWFEERTNADIPWPKPHDGLFLLNKAKGIQKPEGWIHALSIRKSLQSSYDDLLHWDEEGRWLLRYAYEGTDPDYFTNRALRQCMADGVPVAVVVQLKPKPDALYRVLGLANVVSENRGSLSFTLAQVGTPSLRSAEKTLDVALPDESYEPPSDVDARDKVMRSIAVRRGQPKFRKTLLEAYGGACAVTGSTTTAVLEAAHIIAYKGPQTNHVRNGILLRADIHTLFDLGLLEIHPDSLVVSVHHTVSDPYYQQYQGRKLTVPLLTASRPDSEALRKRYSMQSD